VEEIARETGAATGTVKARLSRGRQAMAPYLADNEPGLNGKSEPSLNGKSEPGLNGKEVACDA
jgi:RNA polymerase sigma-70 factor (ECF subfamily)